MSTRRPSGLPIEEITTGERLQSLADISIVPLHVRMFHQQVERYAREMVVFGDYDELGEATFERLSAKRSLFVYTHELRPFIETIWPRLEGRGYVLMTHNSDYEVDASYLPWLEATGEKLRCWFAQNSTVTNPKLMPLPIGVANSMWPHGNLRLLRRAITRRASKPKTELVFLHFNPHTHPRRAHVWGALREAFPYVPPEPPPSRRYPAYLKELARHRFCVCPRGNGIDTHRVWECLYLGVVPIVERSAHTEHWRSCGLPILVVDDWKQVTPAYLTDEASRFAFAHFSSAAIRMSYYARLVEEAAAQGDAAAMLGTAWPDPER